jgi:3-oxoacyl-(acyl-carrier-protein) synthase
MKRSIEDGNLSLPDIGYVNAHGTSTILNDLSEARAISSLFGEKAKNVLVNSTKSMIGHTIAAAGAIEAVVTAMSLSRGIFHPTRNLECKDEGCELNYCEGKAVRRSVEAAISNSCGFSGCNSCLTFRRYNE